MLQYGRLLDDDGFVLLDENGDPLLDHIPEEVFEVVEEERSEGSAGRVKRKPRGPTWRDVAIAKDDDDLMELVTILLSTGVVK